MEKKIRLVAIVLVECLLLSISCQNNNNFPLGPFFKALEANSPKDVLVQFKNAPFDSVIIHYDNYPEIFTDAASIVFQDSSQVRLFEDYCKNNLSLTYMPDFYTIVGAFHRWLNNKPIEIEQLRQEMIEISNNLTEEKHRKPKE